MTLLFMDPRYRDHQTGNHPESPARLEAIETHLKLQGLTEVCENRLPQPAIREQVERIHPREYLDSLEQFTQRGGGQIEVDTRVSTESFHVALRAAGAAAEATHAVLAGTARNAFCVVRPPGHHALAAAPMGFCLLNSVAIAAQFALDQGAQRILIVDFDVHHGNGTQDIFYDRSEVAFLSIHRFPFYPGTGSAEETGTGPGLGSTLNLPLPFGTPPADFLGTFQHHTQSFADRVKPDLILVSAGFDAHRQDPVGNLGLDSHHYSSLTQTLLEIAQTHCHGRLVSVLEGGYHPSRLAESVGLHLERLISADPLA